MKDFVNALKGQGLWGNNIAGVEINLGVVPDPPGVQTGETASISPKKVKGVLKILFKSNVNNVNDVTLSVNDKGQAAMLFILEYLTDTLPVTTTGGTLIVDENKEEKLKEVHEKVVKEEKDKKKPGIPPLPASFIKKSKKTTNEPEKNVKEATEVPPPPSSEKPDERNNIEEVQKIAIQGVIKFSKMTYAELVKGAFDNSKIEYTEIPELDNLTYEEALEVIKYGNTLKKSQI